MWIALRAYGSLLLISNKYRRLWPDILRYNLARTCVVLVHNSFQGILSAAGDVDLGSVANQSLRYHQTDASTASGDDTGEVRNIEEFG